MPQPIPAGPAHHQPTRPAEAVDRLAGVGPDRPGREDEQPDRRRGREVMNGTRGRQAVADDQPRIERPGDQPPLHQPTGRPPARSPAGRRQPAPAPRRAGPVAPRWKSRWSRAPSQSRKPRSLSGRRARAWTQLGTNAKVSGCAPVRPSSPRDRARSIAAICASSRVKSKISELSWMRSSRVDLGKTTSPRCTCQRSVTCPVLLPEPWRSRERRVVEHFPRAIGDQASVTMPCSG